MIIDGRALAADVLTRAKARAEKLTRPPHIEAFVVSETAATKSYLSIKEKRAIDAGCTLTAMPFPEDVTTETLVAALQKSTADGILVQLPLPESIDTKVVCDAIPLLKDADVLSTRARELFATRDERVLLPPVVAAVREIINHYDVALEGKRTVVIGAGFLVGEPAAAWLKKQGAQVTVLTLGDDLALLKDADILVSGAGSPHLITPEMIKAGVVLIDAGTSEASGKLVGDADPACAEHCSLFTPVPGGMGPLAVAKLFENAISLAEKATNPQ